VEDPVGAPEHVVVIAIDLGLLLDLLHFLKGLAVADKVLYKGGHIGLVIIPYVVFLIH